MTDTSLRTALFQRLTQLQLWVLSRFVWYAGLTYLVTLVIFALLRLFTGISVKRIGYFCLRHIVLHPRQGVEIRVGKLGLFPHRPTVARPGFFTFLVTNLEVHVDPEELAQTTSHKKSKKDRGGGIDINDINPKAGVPLLLRPNCKAFKILRWIVSHMKVFNLEMQGTSVVVQGVNSTIFTSIFLRLDLRKTLNTKRSNFVGTLDSYRLASGELPISAKLSVVDVYTAKSLEDEQPWQMFEDLRFDISGVLEVENLRVKEFGVQVHSGRLQLDIDYMLQMTEKLRKLKRATRAKQAQSGDHTGIFPTSDDSAEHSDSENTFSKGSSKQRLTTMARILLQLVMRVQITIGFTEILRIPVSRDTDSAFLAMSMKDLNIDLSRMNSQNSGFKLSFGEDDYAHQAVFTLASFYAGLDDCDRQEEILYVPLITSLTRSNFFTQILKMLAGESSQNNSKVITRAVVYSPHLTLEEKQFPNLIRAALGLSAHHEAKKAARANSGSHSSDNTNGLDMESKLSLLPALDLDVVVNNASTRIVCQDSKVCTGAIFVAASSRLQFGVTAQHDAKSSSYVASALYEAQGTSINYHSANTTKLPIAHSKVASVEVCVRTKPTLGVEVIISQREFVITALQHEVFHAIGQLHLAFTRALNQWIANHPSFYKDVRQKRAARIAATREGGVPSQGHLRRAPQWLSKVSFTAENSSMAVASNRFRGKTNDLLGVKVTTDLFKLVYSNGDPGKEVVDATDGRRLAVSAVEFNVYKADHELLNHDEADIHAMSSHTIVQLSKLQVDMHTHSGVVSDVDISVEPRLKVRLNINLILAFSVLREITDLVLLRHLKEPIDNQYVPDDLEVDFSQMKQKPKIPKSAEQHNINVTLPRALIKIDMPSDDQVMFELNMAKVVIDHGDNPVLTAKAVRLYSQHPFQRGAWCILLSLVQLNAEINTHMKEDKDKVKLDVKGMRVNVPYQFKLYRVIDNGITLAKAMKTLVKQTSQQDIDLTLSPKSVEGIPNIPRVHLKTDQLVVSLEDDYFESDLTLILHTQQDAVAVRFHKLYSLETRIKTMLQKGLERLRNEDERSNVSPKPIRHFTSFNMPNPFQLPKKRNASGHSHNNSHQQNVSFQPFVDVEKVTSNREEADNLASTHDEYDQKDDEEAEKSKNGDKNGDKNDGKDVRKDDKKDNNKDGKKGDKKDDKKSEKKVAPSHRPQLSDDYVDVVARTLAHVPYHKIQTLMANGLELGVPSEDGDPALVKHHPWLSFWSDPDFSEFRRLRVPLGVAGLGKLSVSGAREALLEDFSRMWVDKISNDRMKQHLGAAKKRSQVFHDQLDKDTCLEEHIVDYSQKPLVMQLDFRKLDLVVEKIHKNTRGDMNKFLYDIGKGQPMDTVYSILVPLYLDLKAYGGLKIEVRDYPLPVLQFPPLSRTQDPQKNTALQIKGNLVITEQLVRDESAIRKLFVPLRALPRELRHKRGSDVIEVHRTLTPIKTFTDLKFRSESTMATRVCWCMAYKAGFTSVGEAFHGFSKPPIDPSPVLGFWDKIRLVFHARLDFQLPKSPLSLLMKAGRSPYSLQNEDSGFVFVWKDNVHVLINENDNPKELFKFISDKFELLVPNYIECESEFLHATPAERAWPRHEHTDTGHLPSEKVVFSFNQRNVWKLGMSFERSHESKNNRTLKLRSQEFRPHHKIKLSMPDFVENEDHYDAYGGFRADFIHMAISVVSRPSTNGDDMDGIRPTPEIEVNNANRCACHLTQKVMHHFSTWKDQFSSLHWPPIRTGTLFQQGDAKGTQPKQRTFGMALSTAVYQIALSPLDLSFFHQMRHRSQSDNHDRSSGLKAKIDDLVFDWHTRREPPEIKDNQGNEVVELHGNRRWRMRGYLGQVALQEVHVRVIDAKLRITSSTDALRELQVEDEEDDESEVELDESGSSSMGTSSDAASSSFGGSASQNQSDGTKGSNMYGPRYVGKDYWIDLDDYTDLGSWRTHRSRHPHVKVFPFMYVPQFVFLRRTDFSGKATYLDTQTGHIMPKFNDMNIHDCMLLKDKKATLQNLQLKGRLESLEEQITDFKDSLESMQQQPVSALKSEYNEKIDELKEMIVIAETNADILRKEIAHHTKAEAYENHKTKEYRDSMRKQLEFHLGYDAPKPDSLVYNGQELDWSLGTLESKDYAGSCDDMMAFRNVYVLHAMHLRWNNSVRDLVYRFKSSLGEDKELAYVSCRRAVQYLEELVEKAEKKNGNSEHTGTDTSSSSPDGSVHGKNASANMSGAVNGGIHSIQNHLPGHANHRKPNANEGGTESGTESDSEDSDTKENTHRQSTSTNASTNTHKLGESGNRLKNIYRDIHHVDTKYQTLQKSHSVILVSPRLQLISEEKPDDCLQMTARSVEMQVSDVFSKFGTTESESSRIERRIGAAVSGAGFFILSKEDTQLPAVAEICLERYSGSDENDNTLWPPWISIELCYNKTALQQFLVVNDTSFGVQFYKPNTMHVVSKDEDSYRHRMYMSTHRDDEKSPGVNPDATEEQSENTEETELSGFTKGTARTLRYHGKHNGKTLLSNIIVDAPYLVVSLDSKQFSAVYAIVADLLSYRDPMTRKRDKAIDRIYLANDFRDDFQKTLRDVDLLQKDIRKLRNLHSQLLINSLCQSSTTRDTQVYLIKLERELFRRQTLLLVYMRAFKTSLRRNMDTGFDKVTKLSMLTDSLNLRVLGESGEALLSLHLQRLHFSRLSNDGTSSMNRVTLKGIYGRNTMPNPTYTHMLANYDDPRYPTPRKNAIKGQWTMLGRVGGIPILENVDIRMKPLHIQLEKGIFEFILDFVFPIKNQGKKGDSGDSNTDHSSEASQYISDSDSGSDLSVVLGESDAESVSSNTSHKGPKFIHKLLPKHHRHHSRKADVDEMVDRASNYMSIRNLRIHPTQIMVSYKGNSRHALFNLQNLTIPLPLFEVTNRTWTKLDLIMHVKHMVIKTLLAQSGSIIGNKFKCHKQHTKQDDRDLRLEQLGLVGNRWAEEATRIEADIAMRDTGAPLPVELSHRTLNLQSRHADLLKPAHRRSIERDESDHNGEVKSSSSSGRLEPLHTPRSNKSRLSNDGSVQRGRPANRTVTQLMNSPQQLRMPQSPPSPESQTRPRKHSFMDRIKKHL